MAWEFVVLGGTEALHDGRQADIGPPRQRGVLAALLVEPNRPVSVDQLVDRVWADDPPPSVTTTLRSYLCRLRSVLASAEGPRGSLISRCRTGYVLTIEPSAVDLHQFRALVGQARSTTDPEESAMSLRCALGLWHGEPLAGLDTPWARSVRDSLAREHFEAELDYFDALLHSGQQHELVPTLTSMSAAHPLDERLCGQLMLALYRNGQQAEALQHYHRLRMCLSEELGVDPGPQTQDLYRRLLAGNRSATHQRGQQKQVVPRQLPAAPHGFTGRERELAVLDQIEPERRPMVTVIRGAGGTGKTALALEWAHRNLDRFPDGQVMADLRGFDPATAPLTPSEALCGFLGSLGVRHEEIPEGVAAQAGMYRSLVAGRRLLILLDDARDLDQLAPLLPGSGQCTVIITSRRTLAGLVATHNPRVLTLDVLDDAEATELLASRLGADRLAAEPEAVASLLRHCAGMPLALAITAARAAHPRLRLSAVAAEMCEHAKPLDTLDTGETDVNVRAVIASTVRAVSPLAASVFDVFGRVRAAEIDARTVATLAGLPLRVAASALRELHDAHLVTQAIPGAYRMHALVRLYAAERAS